MVTRPSRCLSFTWLPFCEITAKSKCLTRIAMTKAPENTLLRLDMDDLKLAHHRIIRQLPRRSILKIQFNRLFNILLCLCEGLPLTCNAKLYTVCDIPCAFFLN